MVDYSSRWWRRMRRGFEIPVAVPDNLANQVVAGRVGEVIQDSRSIPLTYRRKAADKLIEETVSGFERNEFNAALLPDELRKFASHDDFGQEREGYDPPEVVVAGLALNPAYPEDQERAIRAASMLVDAVRRGLVAEERDVST